MSRTLRAWAGALLAMAIGMEQPDAAEPAAEAAGLIESVTGGKLLLNLRPRWEHVEQDGKPENADAYTLRTLLGWRTKLWYGLSATLEAINVGHLDGQHYNPNPALASPFPTVADPDVTDLNQLYLDYAGIAHTLVRAGRQSIKLDNVRFLGNVEFRQVMQVFNAVTVENTSLPDTRIYAGFLTRQRTTLGTQRDINEPLVNVRWTWKPGNALIGYGYFQDQGNTGQVTGFQDNSNRIIGARADGGYPLSEKWKLLYTAEYADQHDFSGGDPRIDASYYHAGAGAQWGNLYLRVDQEKLGSNDGLYAFQTALGTNHLFQGWADQFLTTPRQGLRDIYVVGGASIRKIGLYTEWHRFRSDIGSIDFGRELDVGVTWPIVRTLTAKLEYADYQAGDAASGKTDLRKVWLTLVYQY
jgi:Alginate export